MDSKIKFGIIGCSSISKHSVIPSIIQSDYAEVEIIGSRSFEKSKEFSNEFNCKDAELPVIATIASQFADPGVDDLWYRLSTIINDKFNTNFASKEPQLNENGLPERTSSVPPERSNYTAETAASDVSYHNHTMPQTA